MRPALTELFVLPRLRIPLIDRILSMFLRSPPNAEAASPDTDVEMPGDEMTSAPLLDKSSIDDGLQRAFEELTQLRSELRKEESVLFWSKLIKGIARTCKAQYAFVAKHTSSASPPEYSNISTQVPGLAYDNRHNTTEDEAWDKAGKISSEIPSILPIDGPSMMACDLQSVIGEENMTKLPFPMHAYLCMQVRVSRSYSLSLGLMWTYEGLTQLDLSWAAVKLILYALEELAKSRAKLFEFQRFSKKEDHSRRENRVRRPASPRQVHNLKHPSFRAFAPHLSHELRTPMQGVVGMFDVVHADIEDISRDNTGEVADRLKSITQLLEDAHDSAKRAVQAADNIIIAYELDMQVPETPCHTSDDESLSGSSDEMLSCLKWQQASSMDNLKPQTWVQNKNISAERKTTPLANDISAAEEADAFVQTPSNVRRAVMDAMNQDTTENSLQVQYSQLTTTTIPSTRIRDLVYLVIVESFHLGGRPEKVLRDKTELGERFEVHSRSSNGRIARRKIEWSVDPCVPEELYVREKDLAKLISCVFLNAVKFTECGEITVHVTLDNNRADFVLINIEDTGTGIPEEFIPRLFEPFARENQSITRSSDGLGLGLLVAKGLSRRIGGDLTCVWSSTAPTHHGSNFEIAVPIGKGAESSGEHTSPGDSERANSRHTSPSRNCTVTNPATGSNGLLAPVTDRCPPQSQISTQEAVSQSTANPTDATCKEVKAIQEVRPSPGPMIMTSDFANIKVDRQLAKRYPLNCLVAEDNKIVREILVKLLRRLGYEHVYEAFDGRDAVEKMTHSICAATGSEPPCPAPLAHEGEAASELSTPQAYPQVPIDVIFMDIWLPRLDGFAATREILDLIEKSRTEFARSGSEGTLPPRPTVLFTTADLSENLHREVDNLRSKLLLKPHGLQALQKAILEIMAERTNLAANSAAKEKGSEKAFSQALTEETILQPRGDETAKEKNEEQRENN
ncbi:hypothetical protein KEM56_007155 [Ascosphaera pollenicola]|nr:hypothetical protein KEM56_007155 [Ascosphaera pollenicola]